jgi:hypothetical protein
MNEAIDTSVWQVQVLPENLRIASSPSPFGLQTKQIRAGHGICGSLDTRPPAAEALSGYGLGHPAAKWFRFYGNLRAGRALAFEDLEIKNRRYCSNFSQQ